MPIWPFRRSEVEMDAQRLLDAVTVASRRPAFFGDGRISDTLEGRFELMTLHAALALIRLKGEPSRAELAQRFTDLLFRFLDAGLREAGVGDLSVPKRMRALAGSFYGRLEAYASALTAGDEGALRAALGRNILGDEEGPFAVPLAEYAIATGRRHKAEPCERLFAAPAWETPLG
jgi:cytochrome b pre-mRNA-processing protein 3